MLKNLSIRKKLYIGFGSIVAIIIVLLLIANENFTNLREANNLDRRTLRILVGSEEIKAGVLEVASGLRGFLLTGNDRFLGPLDQIEAKLRRNIRETQNLVLEPEQKERLNRLEPMIAEWLTSIVHPLIDKRRELNIKRLGADAIANDPLLLQSIARLTEIRSILNDFEVEENRILENRVRHTEEMRRSMVLILAVGGTLCSLLALLIAYTLSHAIQRPIANLAAAAGAIASGDQSARAQVISEDEIGKVTHEFNRMAQSIQDNQRREQEATNELRAKVDSLLAVVSKATAGDLTGKVTVSGDDAIGRLGNGLATMFDNLRKLLNRVQKAGIQVATSTTEIAASARQQEATGVEQAQTSIEVLSTTKEISANTAQLLKTMEEASGVADDTRSAAGDAHNNLKRMDQAMQHMVSATDSINAKLAALSEKASNINNVLTTITKVADQTNILSLNAAIEAEKAGDAGRGFSVVATEIRRLADQTSVATWDIEQMLKEMQSAVSASVMGMDKFSEEIRRSVNEVRQMGDQLSLVISQVQELTPRFEAVLEGMQSQAIGASQISETMTQLNEATQQAVDSLKATSEAVQQLQYAAQDLQAGVSTFAVSV